MTGIETAALIEKILPYAIGPASGLIICLIFASLMWFLVLKYQSDSDKSVTKLVSALEKAAEAHKATAEAHKLDSAHCHRNLQALHDKVFGLMFDHFSVKKQVEKLEEINVKRQET